MFRFDELPEELPVFPLAGALLLPKAHLPLKIFESRYLDLVYYAHEHDGLIGLIQPTMSPLEHEKFCERYGLEPRNRALYTTGCVGMISDFRQNRDGSLGITLSGLSRFDVVKESPHTESFRQARVDYTRYMEDCLLPLRSKDMPREALIASVREYLKINNMVPKWQHIENACDEELVNALAMICPFDSAEKQALLEMVDLKERADLMIKIMAFDLSCANNMVTDRTLQ